MTVMTVENLVKTYGDVTAVKGISFSVEAGSIFGLLGPNGAGKTTTIECMTGIQKPDGGSVNLLGMDALKAGKALFQKIGVQLQETSYQDKVKVKELCRLFEKMYDTPLDYMSLLGRFGLEDKANAYVQTLSGGQRQKLSILLALIGDPQIVFLDELTTGLDPKARRDMWESIKQLKDMGKTVFLTTHYMEEATYLCDQIGIINKGELLVLDNLAGVVAYAGMAQQVSFKGDQSAVKVLKVSLGDGVRIRYEAGMIYVTAEEEDLISQVVLALHQHQVAYEAIDLKRPTLEDAYIKMIQEEVA